MNKLDSAWKTLSLHFKQTYEGGYRYLDKCGEFMVAATEALNVVPGEIKPTGAKMEIPEKGIKAGCDVTALTAIQELPIKDGEEFVEVCCKLADLAATHFRPANIVKNGFLWKSYFPFSNVSEMLSATLKFGGNSHMELAKVLEMVPDYKKLEYFFASGSKELQVGLQPVTFQQGNLPKHNPAFKATRGERDRIDRSNRFAERVRNVGLTNALVLSVDLMENNPPVDAQLPEHFKELYLKTEALQMSFSIQ